MKSVKDVSEEALLGCMHCGFCLQTCPSYFATGNEAHSPRGRLALLRFVEDGKLDFTHGLDERIYGCLQCLACVQICPAGVPVTDLISEAREIFNRKIQQSRVKDPFFDYFFQDMAWMERISVPVRLAQKLGLTRLAKMPPFEHLLPHNLQTVSSGIPPLSFHSARHALPAINPAVDTRKYRVGYFLSCLDDVLFEVNARALIHLLTHSGCEVVIPEGIACCGIPHQTYGKMDAAKAVARKNIKAFGKYSDLDAIISDCGSCGSTLKGYPKLFQGDPEEDKAKEFAVKVVDISEWLTKIDWKPTKKLENKIRVTYHQSCHLGRGQGITEEPRNLMRSVEGLELVEMEEADWCCGGAGSYNLSHCEYSMKILDRKMKHIAETEVPIVATGCPACEMQLRIGASRSNPNLVVTHPVRLLDSVCK